MKRKTTESVLALGICTATLFAFFLSACVHNPETRQVIAEEQLYDGVDRVIVGLMRIQKNIEQEIAFEQFSAEAQAVNVAVYLNDFYDDFEGARATLNRYQAEDFRLDGCFEECESIYAGIKYEILEILRNEPSIGDEVLVQDYILVQLDMLIRRLDSLRSELAGDGRRSAL